MTTQSGCPYNQSQHNSLFSSCSEVSCRHIRCPVIRAPVEKRQFFSQSCSRISQRCQPSLPSAPLCSPRKCCRRWNVLTAFSISAPDSLLSTLQTDSLIVFSSPNLITYSSHLSCFTSLVLFVWKCNCNIFDSTLTAGQQLQVENYLIQSLPQCCTGATPCHARKTFA